jgi:carbon-monoxide dehydrogenase large subunit
MNILPGNMRSLQVSQSSVWKSEVTEKGHFIDDKAQRGALWLHVLRSPHAHTRHVNRQHRRGPHARCRSGLHRRRSDRRRYRQAPRRLADDGAPRRMLAHEIVRFTGEPVAAVVATSRGRA